ncbi:MAG TPA: dephospho-CoA kinase [Actinomycetota bacterium]
MLLVGLTGGLGAGKSTVARMLAERGAVIVDADELARRSIEPGTRGHRKVLEVFGDEVEARGGSIDRRALADVVFEDPEARRALESITHPEVFRMLAEEVERRRDSGDVVVFDAPLIVETGMDTAMDLLVVVAVAPDTQVDRVVARGMDRAEAEARIAAQASQEEREAKADVILRNDGDLRDLERQVDALWDRLRREAGG